ncbi:MAG TPA: uroporphyrinogen-III synthase [Brevundimonas sp.]|uniref:uroporphyrinogen-III synthase n=1 Tax=Brevundimonas sp. TaxID=1871086 RepID=UPI002CA9888B|nr:uroporphyrinogen-III synthase [Brevundimonas sp.]HRO32456.1 uroporphyrinogen-III synthase [Brevundimonas sp.]
MTRAEPGAARTAARVRTLGLTPVVAPLLRIEPLAVETPPTPHDALVFTSPNGLAAWTAISPDRAAPVLAVGDATARAAQAAGFGVVRSAGGDLNDLAALIRSDPALKGARLLHPGAETPAGDLNALVAGHATVRALPVYRAVSTGAQAPDGFDVVLIHSPRAGRALADALSPDQARGRQACAISAAAAAPLTALLAAIAVAARPDETSLLAALTACLGKPPGAV